mgnify:CR=1 FL=1
MTAKEKYKTICESGEYYVPLFLQYWWMDAVCKGKQWDVVLAFDREQPTGAMPFLFGRKYGLTYIIQPQLTQYSGPCYFYPKGLKGQNRLEFEKQTAHQLISQIDRIKPALFIQNFSPQITNWLPFYWAGYHQTTRYTYRLEDISNPVQIFENFDREKRQRKIRRYEQSTTVRYDMSPEAFADFHRRYWENKGKKDLLSRDLIVSVCNTAIMHGNGIIASLFDDNGRLLCARFVAYDGHNAYALMSAVDADLHRSGHNETLIWALLQHLSPICRSFDFEGSMDEGIEYFYRSFGARQTPFFEITKCKSLIRPFLRFAT